jgi:hypothetical protein
MCYILTFLLKIFKNLKKKSIKSHQMRSCFNSFSKKIIFNIEIMFIITGNKDTHIIKVVIN